VLGWPLLAAVAHTGGAAALVTWLTVCLVRSQGRAIPVSQKTPHASPVSAASSARA
jgi:cytochrome c oxidase assembly protein subunit 15